MLFCGLIFSVSWLLFGDHPQQSADFCNFLSKPLN
jgi:hypothetical protein